MLLPLIQVAAVPQGPRVDLPTHVRRPCEVSPDPNEIVVCGKSHDDQFRLKPIPRPAGMKAPVDGPGIDFDIGKAHGNIYSTTEGRLDGIPDKRLMVTVRMPF